MLTRISFERACQFLRNAVIVTTGLLGVAVLVRLSFLRTWNYDELSHAHMAWLVSAGEVPYRDFAINHFPFFWIPVSALMRMLPEGSATLMDLRLLALLLNLVFIVALWTLIVRELPRDRRIWAAACFVPVVFSYISMHFLIEFRPDALANAMLFASLAWLAPAGERRAAVGFLCGLLIGAAVLVNTKYVLFPFILGPVALLARAREIRRVWPAALAMGLGFGAAFVCGYFQLLRMGIVPGDAWRMVVVYNAAAEKARIYGFGLAHSVMQQPLLLAYIVCGLAGCGILFSQQRRPPGATAVAILIFLVISLAAITRPWTQYLASWFLLAAWFPVRSLPEFAVRLNARGQAAAACCVAIVVIAELANSGIARSDTTNSGRATQDRLIDYACREVPPDGFVVAGFKLHPVFRRDTFFKVVFDITDRGPDGLEEIMPQLTTPPYSEHFQRPGYEKEVKLRPPSLIVPRSFFSNAQMDVLNAYLKLHPDSYHYVTIPDTSLSVLERNKTIAPETP